MSDSIPTIAQHRCRWLKGALLDVGPGERILQTDGRYAPITRSVAIPFASAIEVTEIVSSQVVEDDLAFYQRARDWASRLNQSPTIFLPT